MTEKTEWKVGDYCWTNCFGGDAPRKLKVVYVTESHVVAEGDTERDINVLRMGLLAKTRSDAIRPYALERLRGAEEDVKRHTENVRYFKKDLAAAKRELAAAKKSLVKLGMAK